MRHLGFVLVALAALVLSSMSAEELKSKHRLFPKSNETYSSSQWAEIIKRLQPSIDNPNAKRITQPSGSGKVAKKGVINKQIIGGENATLGQFPWQVALQVEEQWICGGSLILRNWVLTAAHCAGKSYEVLIGTISRDKSSLSSGGIIMTSTVSFVHEQYNEYTLRNDIALVKLPEEVTLTDNIKTVALPPPSDASKTFLGTLVTVSGFGLTVDNGEASKVLKFVEVTVITQADCADYFSPTFVTSGVICTRHITKATCQGDSGGPLVYRDSSDTWTQLGIVSFGSGISCLDGPSGFTRVTSYLDWISARLEGKPIPTTSTTTTKKPTTMKPAKCATLDFSTLLLRCCKSAPKDLVIFNKTDKSCKTSSSKSFNTYYLNKYQNDKVANNVMYDEKTKKGIGKESSFVNCYLKSKGVIDADTGLIDVDKILELISSNQKPETEAHDLVWSSLFQCYLQLNGSVPLMISTNRGAKIDGTATMILQCTQLVLNMLCTDRVTSDNKCVKDYGNFDYCSQIRFISPITAQKAKEMFTRKKALRTITG